MPIPTSPNTQLYTLGKGILYVGAWDGSTSPEIGELVDVGNCTEFNAEVTEEVLDHYSSRSGTRRKDRQVTLETGYTLSFTLDEVSVTNLAMFLRGLVEGTNKIQAATALDREFMVRFVSDNPLGTDSIWECWKVRITPSGAFNLISDEWQAMAFTGEGLADEANHSDSPFFDVTLSHSGTTTTE